MDKTEQFESMIHMIDYKNGAVLFGGLKANYGRLKVENGEVRIAIRSKMNFDEYIFNLAHEIAHLYLHFDKGNIIQGPKNNEYEEQADRAANMLIDMLSVIGEDHSVSRKGAI